MEPQNKKIVTVTGFVFIVLITGFALLEMKLKPFPQLFMMGYAVIALIFSYSEFKYGFKLMFYLLLGCLLLFGYFNVSERIIDFFNPCWDIRVLPDGRIIKRRNSPLFEAAIITLILTPVSIFFYRKVRSRVSTLEAPAVVIFLIVTTVIFFINEVF